MMLPIEQDKAALFIPPMDFITPNEFNLVEHEAIYFFVQPEVLLELMPYPSHLKTQSLYINSFTYQKEKKKKKISRASFLKPGECDVGSTTKIISEFTIKVFFILFES